MSLIGYNDSEARIVNSGGVVVRKEHGYSEFEVVDWDVNRRDGWTFDNANSEQIKFYLRRASRNERIEDVVIEWEEEGLGGSVQSKFPTFFHCIEQVRVLINNVEVVDIKHHEIIQNLYRQSLFAKRNSDDTEANYHFSWITGESTHLISEEPLGNENSYRLPIIPVFVLERPKRFRATFTDILPGVFENLPLSNNVNFIEIQMSFLSPLYSRYLGGFDNNPALPQLVVHNNIICYSKHKKYQIPLPKQNWVLHHNDYEVLRINPPFNFSPNPTGGGRIEIDISQNYIGEIQGIQRIIVYKQSTDGTSGEAHKHFKVDNIQGLSLWRNGLVVQATDFFYKSKYDIAYQTEKFYKRRYEGLHTGSIQNTPNGSSVRATPFSPNWGQMFPQCFIDTTTLTKTLNEGNGIETPLLDAGGGLDNGQHLTLRIDYETDITLEPDIQLIILIEFNRYSKLLPNGEIVKIK